MGTQMKPLDKRQVTLLEATAEKNYGKDSDVYRMFMILRYTGAHESVLINPACNLHEEVEEGDTMIVWNRPKKKGAISRTSILKHKSIQFNINYYSAEIGKRKRKNTRQYVYRMIKKLGIEAGVPNLAPQSLRHTLAVELLNEGWAEIVVAQLFNISRKTLAWYGRYTNKGLNEKLKNMGW